MIAQRSFFFFFCSFFFFFLFLSLFLSLSFSSLLFFLSLSLSLPSTRADSLPPAHPTFFTFESNRWIQWNFKRTFTFLSLLCSFPAVWYFCQPPFFNPSMMAARNKKEIQKLNIKRIVSLGYQFKAENPNVWLLKIAQRWLIKKKTHPRSSTNWLELMTTKRSFSCLTFLRSLSSSKRDSTRGREF